jgi:ATP-dependent Clp protease ATP-binding subunit ClpA
VAPAGPTGLWISHRRPPRPYGLGMMERFSDAARRVVALSDEEAERLGHAQVGTEHLLLGLLGEKQTWVAEMLSSTGVTLLAAREKVVEAVGPSGNGPGPMPRPLSARAQRALDRAGRFSRQRGAQWVEPEDILAGVLDVEGRAGQVLRGLGVDVAALGETVRRSRGPSPRTGASAPPGQAAPHCPRCHADLTSALAHRTVTSRGEPGQQRPFVVTFCSVCGSALTATPS